MSPVPVAGRGHLWGPPLARSVLFVLVAFFAVLPFRPVIEGAGPRLAAASSILSVGFLYLALTSWARPVRSFWTGFALVALVTVLASLTGALRLWWAPWAVLVVLVALALGAAVGSGPDGANPGQGTGSQYEDEHG